MLNEIIKVESSVVQYLGAIEIAFGINENLILLDESEKAEIRNKIQQARTLGWGKIETVISEYSDPIIISTTKLIEKCAVLITEL